MKTLVLLPLAFAVLFIGLLLVGLAVPGMPASLPAMGGRNSEP